MTQKHVWDKLEIYENIYENTFIINVVYIVDDHCT